MSDWTALQEAFQQYTQHGVLPAGYDRDPSTATMDSVREYLIARAAGRHILRNALRSAPSYIIMSPKPLTAEERKELRNL